MGNYKLLVLSKPVEGREDEYNSWYSDQHLDDVLAVPGFVAAQRFVRKGDPIGPGAPYDYFAVYEIDHDDPQSVIDEMTSRVNTERMPLSDAMAGDFYCVLYDPITPRKLAK